MSEIKIITNHHEREVIEAFQLSPAEREEFDYIDWAAVDRCETSRQFVRYQGKLLDLGDVLTTTTLPQWSPLRAWDGYQDDSFFSGIVIRWTQDFESVIVGRYLA